MVLCTYRRLKQEHHILSAGLTGLTDCSDPGMTWLPSGHLRWTQPATLPLDSVQTQTLTSAQEQNHARVYLRALECAKEEG